MAPRQDDYHAPLEGRMKSLSCVVTRPAVSAAAQLPTATILDVRDRARRRAGAPHLTMRHHFSRNGSDETVERLARCRLAARSAGTLEVLPHRHPHRRTMTFDRGALNCTRLGPDERRCR